MDRMDRRERADLDRFITGNWGEDQFPEENQCTEEHDRGQNCIEGMKCPKCSQHTRFKIAIQAWATVEQDSSEVKGDQEWDENSSCICPNCNFSGKVGAFLE
jgi:hypothetical protein